MSSTFIIARREFRSYFDSPVAYVVIILSLTILGFLFFHDFWTVNRMTLASLYATYLPWAMIFPIIPAITMHLFAEEKRTGTLELLITMPVRDRDVVLGKFLATLGLITVLLLLTATYPLTIGRLGTLDVGPVWVGILGLLLEASAGIAIGLWASSITEKQVVAFMITFIILLLLWLMDFLLGFLGNGTIGDVISFISFQHRLMPFGRGLLDLRNVVYFVSVTVFFLTLTTRSLESRKWS